jgi:dolichyl-phosphate-mannose--protein O-mannosyl transferase
LINILEPRLSDCLVDFFSFLLSDKDRAFQAWMLNSISKSGFDAGMVVHNNGVRFFVNSHLNFLTCIQLWQYRVSN